jgi:hypothetical protein
MADAPVQFMRWSSTVDPDFWQTLADKKLESMKLSEEPVPISAAFCAAHKLNDDHAASMRFPLTSKCFDGDFSPEQAVAPGELMLVNTAESFKQLDKADILAKTSQRMWEDICSGAAAADPSLLNRFVLIAYADLKTWTFYHWFCFPALSIPSSSGSVPQLLEASQLASAHFGAALAAVQAPVLAFRAAAPKVTVFTVCLPGAAFEGAVSVDPPCSLGRRPAPPLTCASVARDDRCWKSRASWS